MIAYRKITLLGLFVFVVALSTPIARAQAMPETLHVKFSGPVELPGVALPAGSYIFEALQNGHLTRILSEDRMHVYATLTTVPRELLEPVEDATVMLEDNTAGAPERVAAWFFPGESIGNEFIYPEEKESAADDSITLTKVSSEVVNVNGESMILIHWTTKSMVGAN